MYKTTLKRKRPTAKSTTHRSRKLVHKSDLDKIKALLLEASPGWQHRAEDKFNQSLENIKERSADVQDYLAERPMKSIGFSLVAGLFAGIFIGFYINR